jgi:hypothetical protein
MPASRRWLDATSSFRGYERRSIERRFCFLRRAKKIPEIFFGVIQIRRLGSQLGEFHTIRLYRHTPTRGR